MVGKAVAVGAAERAAAARVARVAARAVARAAQAVMVARAVAVAYGNNNGSDAGGAVPRQRGCTLAAAPSAVVAAEMALAPGRKEPIAAANQHR